MAEYTNVQVNTLSGYIWSSPLLVWLAVHTHTLCNLVKECLHEQNVLSIATDSICIYISEAIHPLSTLYEPL